MNSASAPSDLRLRAPSGSAVFATVLTEGPISRLEVARRADLSPGAVTRAVRPLLAAGYLEQVPSGQAPSGAGRPATLLRAAAGRASFIGFKVTGDELIAVRTDLLARTLESRSRPLPFPSVLEVVSVMADLVEELERGTPVAGVGVAISGDVDSPAGRVRFSPFLDWRDVSLARRLEAATRRPCVVENDVRALTVAEQWFGAGRGAHSFAVVTIGAGIGCGLVLDGRLMSGAHGVAGELGHVPTGGRRRCRCGATGCLETLASSGAIAEALGDPGLTPASAAELARSGHPGAVAAHAAAGEALGRALASVANLFGPERILIAGEGVAAYDLLRPALEHAFAASVFGAASRCQILVRPHAFEEWARGAAGVAIRSAIEPEPLAAAVEVASASGVASGPR